MTVINIIIISVGWIGYIIRVKKRIVSKDFCINGKVELIIKRFRNKMKNFNWEIEILGIKW